MTGMPQSGTNNRRIARNTVFLYIRMILILLVTLYTSRVVLSVLGVEDYGIYSVVGGVVAMFAFLNNSMATATQRFLTYELGRGDSERLRNVFSAAVHIHLIIGIAIVLLAETAGLWLLNDKLVISPERMSAARWVYHFSVVTFFINVIQIPYNALIIAHEKMSVYAYVSIAEAAIKLVFVFLLTVIPCDKLVLYAFFMLIIQASVRIFYQLWCRSRYDECRVSAVRDRRLYSELAGFAGWNIFGSLAWVLKDQGINIILNLFFGPAVNAAKGVASQVSVSVNGFVSNFQTALNPQIVKNYAMGERREMEKLVFRGLKFSFFLLFFIALPLMLNLEPVLGVWLKEVPEHSAAFILLIMVDTLAGTLSGSPLMTSIAATGKIRNYQIIVSLIIMLGLPVSYIMLRQGMQPEIVYVVTIVFTMIAGAARFMFARAQIGFSLRAYMVKVLVRVACVLLLSLPLPLYFRLAVFKEDSIATFLALCGISVICVGASVWVAGLEKDERKALWRMVVGKLKNRMEG